MDDLTTPTPAPAQTETPTPSASATPDDARREQLVDDELLVEEISIDGMCGVY